MLSDSELEQNLVGAALKYGVTADWFESFTAASTRGDTEAAVVFTHAESALRRAASRLLKSRRNRAAVLADAIEESKR